MGRHLPFYVPDSESRNFPKKAKLPFYSRCPRSSRCFALPGDSREIFPQSWVHYGLWEDVIFFLHSFNGIYEKLSHKCIFSSCLIIYR